MSDLIEWLRACIAEDEAAAQLVPNWDDHVAHEMDGFSANARRYAAEMTPAYVLAVCKAHREILDLHARDLYGDCSTCGEVNGWTGDGEGGEFYDSDRSAADYPCATVKALATIYAGRPGYRQEWRP